MWQIDESLRRLGTDYVDLYQIHRFDPATPLEETLEALDDLVRAGKVRYLGASSMDAWRFSKALHLQRANGWARFVTMQDHYNLVNREEEREMLPLCADEGVGSLPWSPLARGRLTRDWDATTDRSETDEFGKTLYAAQEDSDRRVAAAVAEVASPWRAARAGRAGLGVAEPRRHRSHRGRDEGRAHRGRGRVAGSRAHGRRGVPARGALRAARGRRVLTAPGIARATRLARTIPVTYS